MFKGLCIPPNNYTLELFRNSVNGTEGEYLYSISSEKPRDPSRSALLSESVRMVGHFTQNLYQESRTHSSDQRAGAAETTPANRNICEIQNPSDLSRQ